MSLYVPLVKGGRMEVDMRKSIALKSLLRSPIKTLLTVLLIVAASFALFSRITDCAVTMREMVAAKDVYHGVAALDNTVPDRIVIEYTQTGGTAAVSKVDDKPWPTEAQLKEFSALPGVTLADMRYMTAGRIEDYKRLTDEDGSGSAADFVLEGTYAGYEDITDEESEIKLNFEDIMVLAGSMELDQNEPVTITATVIEDMGEEKAPYPREFFEGMEKGRRCLLVGNYNTITGENLVLDHGEKALRMIDGLGENYLQTEAFAYYQGKIAAINQSIFTYDIVYTSDMRAIPRFNERYMVMSQGRPLMAEDTDACVVSELFLEEQGLAIGDRINIQFGNKLFHQNAVYGATADNEEELSDFTDDAELKIVGAYRFTDDVNMRVSEFKWAYSSSTVFVPKSFLPVEIPADYELSPGEFSVFAEDALDIETFRENVELFAARMDLALRFSDGGWLGVKDSFEIGFLTSFLTTVLYGVGAVLALFLAVYLYIKRNQNAYAIMRTLGVSVSKACNAVVLPLAVLSVFAVSIGGMAGVFYTMETAAETLTAMMSSAPAGYVMDASVSVWMIILCLCLEIGFILAVTIFFLRKMGKISPLELLQEGTGKSSFDKKHKWKSERWENSDSLADNETPVLAGLDAAKISAAGKMTMNRTYSAFCQVTTYILRHMRRGIGKTMVSFVIMVLLTAGIGMFGLTRLAYEDALREIDVKGRALEFSSSSILEMSRFDLMDAFYSYGGFTVRTNSEELHTQMTFTNDINRYLDNKGNITYAKGFDSSDFGGNDAVCLIGSGLAETLGIRPGDEIALISDSFYSTIEEMYKNNDVILNAVADGEQSFESAVEKRTVIYQVIGIIESDYAEIGSNIFAGINDTMEAVYGQPFPCSFCEFILSDNERLSELESVLSGQKTGGKKYAPMASYYVDTEGLKNVERIYHLLESLFPIAVAAAVVVGVLVSGLVILQSAKEAAFLRILGVTKRRVRCMLTLEQVLLCITGIIFVVCGLAFFSPGLFARSTGTLVFCYVLYFLGCFCGAVTAAVHVTRGRLLELLQIKE